MATKKVGSTGRYGVRYGQRLRAKVNIVEKTQNKSKKCPYCNRDAVKRVSAGIWQCKKCESKFTGKAYRIGE